MARDALNRERVKTIQEAIPEVPVIGSAYSYLRQFSPNLAAGMISGGHTAPWRALAAWRLRTRDFPNDVIKNGGLDAKKVCITCGQCAALLRAGIPAGCVVRDREVYKVKA